MKIGIDIDNTLTEVQEKLNEAAYTYAVSLGKNLEGYDKLMQDEKNDGTEYAKRFQFNYEELKYFLKDIQENITNNAIPRKNAKEVIDKLKNDGHQIYIITARDSEFHNNPYVYSKNWLDKNKRENIDLYIDDQLENCLNILNAGIQTIMITDKKYDYDNITMLKNWDDIYNFISELEK